MGINGILSSYVYNNILPWTILLKCLSDMSFGLFNSVYCTVICRTWIHEESVWQKHEGKDPPKSVTIPLEAERAARVSGHIWESPSIHHDGIVGISKAHGGNDGFVHWVLVQFNCTELPLEHLPSQLLLILLTRQFVKHKWGWGFMSSFCCQSTYFKEGDTDRK